MDIPLKHIRKENCEKYRPCPSRSVLFYGTVRDNIRLHHKRLTDEDIEQAAAFVQAHSFIEKLPNGTIIP